MSFDLTNDSIYRFDVVGQANGQAIVNTVWYRYAQGTPGSVGSSQEFFQVWELEVWPDYRNVLSIIYTNVHLRLRELAGVVSGGTPPRPVFQYGLDDFGFGLTSLPGLQARDVSPTYVAASGRVQAQNGNVFIRGSKRYGPIVEGDTQSGVENNRLTPDAFTRLLLAHQQMYDTKPIGVGPDNDLIAGVFSGTRALVQGGPLLDHFFDAVNTNVFELVGSQLTRKVKRQLS